MSESLFRLISLALFIIGFVAGIASTNKDAIPAATQALVPEKSHTGVVVEQKGSILEDLQLAEEVNSLNEGRWNQDVHAINQDGLSRAQELLEADAEQAFGVTAAVK